MIAAIREVRAFRWQGSESQRTADHLAMEEPMEIRLGGTPVAVTMRTPGNDYELETRFLFTERILSPAAQNAAIGHSGDAAGADPKDVVAVIPAEASVGTAP